MNQKQPHIPFTVAFFLFGIIACTQLEMHVISVVNALEVVSREKAMNEWAARDSCPSQVKEMGQ